MASGQAVKTHCRFWCSAASSSRSKTTRSSASSRGGVSGQPGKLCPKGVKRYMVNDPTACSRRSSARDRFDGELRSRSPRPSRPSSPSRQNMQGLGLPRRRFNDEREGLPTASSPVRPDANIATTAAFAWSARARPTDGVRKIARPTRATSRSRRSSSSLARTRRMLPILTDTSGIRDALKIIVIDPRITPIARTADSSAGAPRSRQRAREWHPACDD